MVCSPFQSLPSLIGSLRSLLRCSSKNGKVEALVSYEERESEEKKKLVEDFLTEMKKEFSVTKVPVDDYREDFKCDDIHILRITQH